MSNFVGHVTTLSEHLGSYGSIESKKTAAIRLWPTTEAVDDLLVACTIDDVLLTSFFVPIDIEKRLMFLDQTYSGAAALFPMRFALDGDRYSLESEPVISPGRHVVIGGPVDLVWYHWLFNWCPRILLLKSLRSDLFEAPDVRFVIHPHAMCEPFRAVLDTFGLAEDRFLVIDPEKDYRLEQATLVSFLDQNKLYPSLITQFSDHLLDGFAIDAVTAHAGIFASRQDLPPPKRRIANFAAIEPVLKAFGIRAFSFGELPAAEQARLFHEAAVVVGAHGSDLSNILFCRPGTPVIVIENQFSVDHDLHIGLSKLAEVLGLKYHLLVSATTDDAALDLSTVQRIARDYVVDPDRLERAILLATSRAEGSGAAGTVCPVGPP